MNVTDLVVQSCHVVSQFFIKKQLCKKFRLRPILPVIVLDSLLRSTPKSDRAQKIPQRIFMYVWEQILLPFWPPITQQGFSSKT